MLTVSTPYAGQPPSPAPYSSMPPPPPKKRPSPWWFGLGGVLLVLASIALGVAGAMVIHFFVDADTSFPMVGVHRVELPAHTQRMVFSDGDTEGAFCSAHEPNGRRVSFNPLGDSSLPDHDVSDFARFDTGDGRLVFQCFGSAADTLWITAVPDFGSLVMLFLLGVLAFVIGGLGVGVLLVTTVLWFSRRPTPPPYLPPPGYGAPPTSPRFG